MVVTGLLSALCTLTPFLGAVNAGPAPAVVPRQASGGSLSSCPGYKASNVAKTPSGLKADLTLAGSPCNAYGTDLKDLTLTVEYQTDERLHVLIQDKANQVYQVPSQVFPRPSAQPYSGSGTNGSDLVFNYKESPFSFSVTRRSNGEVLFDSSAASLVFESQYVRLRTSLPANPSLYGLGEHTDPFMLNTTNYTRTIWNRDSYGIPPGTNLYGDHKVYFDHRGSKGTHAVYLLNSNGADIRIDNDGGANQYLEYNLLGGVLDFYFVSGPTPVEAARQFSQVVGKTTLMPYWGYGLHQCRYGYRDIYEVAEVVANYSRAGIPLETMWTDIDYMYLRRTFTLDQERFFFSYVREFVNELHNRHQHYVVMVDPAVAYQNSSTFNDGLDLDVYVKRTNGSVFEGVVWPGRTVYPDWFHPNAQKFWTNEFAKFFDEGSGVDIDALWIDMNEASNFCPYPCSDPVGYAIQQGDPPRPPPIRMGSPRPLPEFGPDFQLRCRAEVTFNVNATTFYGENIVLLGNIPSMGSNDISNAVALSADTYPIWSVTIDVPADVDISYQYLRAEPDGSYIYESTNRTIRGGDCNSTGQVTNDEITTSSPTGSSKVKRNIAAVNAPAVNARRQTAGNQKGLPGRDLISPAYEINNAAGSISNHTLQSDLVHYGGWVDYDTHDLYGAMMSEASRQAMLARRPGLRPMVITRSTFSGSGRQVGHWLGDNLSLWSHYLFSISGLLQFNALYQFGMVGSDVCGFGMSTNVLLCARWAMLGAFSTFYRNHADIAGISQEFYRWPIVEQAAKNAIEIRYKLLDYIYTAVNTQHADGTPALQPMFFVYPEDAKCNALQYQYFYGPSLMVAPVTQENSTTTEIYLPNDLFYDYYTQEPVHGQGSTVTLTDVAYDTIPLYYRGGSIVPQRVESAITTTALRTKDFELIIAPSANGTARGSLYLDDGVSIEQPATSDIKFEYSGRTLKMSGTFGYSTKSAIAGITILGSGSGNGTSGGYGGYGSYGGHHSYPGHRGKPRGHMMKHRIPLTGPTTIHI
ncbi:glycoside hydrolase family 31 protein [Piedraia hortae CBS 480.64]|uniref:Glycoside hydrolase family 31 protein n=1 Tax=Piedraia hortae CBS 480.64 TaxID=1314780 RepID=A0A6A7C1Y6_9PEZI|nr:glycoside hydrolase family 31 protein [Piedraia hortae CBS 480.64]